MVFALSGRFRVSVKINYRIRIKFMTTKHRFISVAKRQFTENGFDRTSIASIADELGLTKQALLHHFGPKKNLYGEVLL